MAKKAEEAPVRRSSYIDVNTGQQTLSDDLSAVGSEGLRQTIAETRAAQVADLQAKLEEAENIIQQKQEALDSVSLELGAANDALAELKKAPRGVESEVYEYTDEETGESYIVVQVDTQPETGRIVVYVNDGPIYDNDPEIKVKGEKKPTVTENTEESATQRMVAAFDSYLGIAAGGASAIIEQVQGRDPVSRAAWIAQLSHFTKTMHENAGALDRLVERSLLAAQMLEE